MNRFSGYFGNGLSGRNNLPGCYSEGVALCCDASGRWPDSDRVRFSLSGSNHASADFSQDINHRRPAWTIRFAILVLASLFLSLGANAASNNTLTDAQLLQIKFVQKLNSQVSPDLVFRDETGRQVRLGDYFGKRPIVLILGYYTCPMLCSLVMNGVTEGIRDLRWSAGQQFEIIFVSIDPNESPKLAAAKKRTYLRDYGRPGTANGWHFLTAVASPPNKTDPPAPNKAVQTLAKEIGFRYAYDAGLKEYAHPSGFVVLTPQGKVAHYFFGVTFSARELDTALHDARARKIDSPVQEFILLCCEYNPLRGKYGYLVMDVVRVGGIGMVVALGAYFIRPPRRKPEKGK